MRAALIGGAPMLERTGVKIVVAICVQTGVRRRMLAGLSLHGLMIVGCTYTVIVSLSSTTLGLNFFRCIK